MYRKIINPYFMFQNQKYFQSSSIFEQPIPPPLPPPQHKILLVLSFGTLCYFVSKRIFRP